MDEMTNKAAHIEALLSRLTPRAPGPDFAARVTSALAADRLTLSDRILILFGSAGALAAAFIVAISLAQTLTHDPSLPPAPNRQSLQEMYQSLALK